VGPGERPRLAAPDSYLTEPCAPPANLPVGEMTQRAIERFWSRDRVSLVECGARQQALIDYYAERDALLGGK